MKKICLLLFLGILSLNTFSQCLPYPTNREVYDYAVGDTFQHRSGANSGYSSDTYVIILGRNNYGNDSIVYSTKVIRAVFGQGINVTTSNQTITELDNAIYFSWSNCAFDSIFCSYNLGDTFYTSLFHQWITVYCSGIGQNITAQASLQLEYSRGLGITRLWSCSNTDPCNSCSSTILIYAHKANGLVYGSPDNWLFSGIEDIVTRGPTSLFPNPTSSSFTLQLASAPTTETYFQMFDAMGRLARREEINSTTTTILRSNLPSGIYFWQLESANKIFSRGKLVME